MTKKDFTKLTNPADQYLNTMEATATSKAVPAKENRSRHVSILLKPTTADDMKYIAKLEGTSVNNIVNELLDNYVAEYRKSPARAKKLDQALKLFS